MPFAPISDSLRYLSSTYPLEPLPMYIRGLSQTTLASGPSSGSRAPKAETQHRSLATRNQKQTFTRNLPSTPRGRSSVLIDEALELAHQTAVHPVDRQKPALSKKKLEKCATQQEDGANMIKKERESPEIGGRKRMSIASLTDSGYGSDGQPDTTWVRHSILKSIAGYDAEHEVDIGPGPVRTLSVLIDQSSRVPQSLNQDTKYFPKLQYSDLLASQRKLSIHGILNTKIASPQPIEPTLSASLWPYFLDGPTDVKLPSLVLSHVQTLELRPNALGAAVEPPLWHRHFLANPPACARRWGDEQRKKAMLSSPQFEHQENVSKVPGPEVLSLAKLSNVKVQENRKFSITEARYCQIIV